MLDKTHLVYSMLDIMLLLSYTSVLIFTVYMHRTELEVLALHRNDHLLLDLLQL